MTSRARPPGFNWGAGEYEVTASELKPVSEHVVALASPSRGDRVLDIACGTGNAALLAARAGAVVTGLDAAGRLVDVARQRAAAEQLEATFVVGDLHDLPFVDDAFDVALSISGLIFAQEPGTAVGEVVRVLAPEGRALITTWIPDGAVHEAIGVTVRAVAAATGRTRPRFAWHDEAAFVELVRGCGGEVEFEDAEVAFSASSVEEYFERIQIHPMHVSTRPLLERAGTYDQVREQIVDIFRERNEDPGGFRVTSRYRIATVTPAVRQ
jgi:SAM-dependent methyltransferase